MAPKIATCIIIHRFCSTSLVILHGDRILHHFFIWTAEQCQCEMSANTAVLQLTIIIIITHNSCATLFIHTRLHFTGKISTFRKRLHENTSKKRNPTSLLDFCVVFYLSDSYQVHGWLTAWSAPFSPVHSEGFYDRESPVAFCELCCIRFKVLEKKMRFRHNPDSKIQCPGLCRLFRAHKVNTGLIILLDPIPWGGRSGEDFTDKPFQVFTDSRNIRRKRKRTGSHYSGVSVSSTPVILLLCYFYNHESIPFHFPQGEWHKGIWNKMNLPSLGLFYHLILTDE